MRNIKGGAGDVNPIVEPWSQAHRGSGRQQASEPSVAADGTFAYVGAEGQRQLVWRDREGGRIGAIGQPQRDLQYPSLSPDGRYIAATGYEKGIPESDIWIFDLVPSGRA